MKNEIREELKNFLETNENELTTTQILWDTAKAVLRGKFIEIQRIARNYYEEIYAKEFENLGEMTTFLEKYNLSKLNEEEAENRNRPITADEIEAVIKTLPTHKSPTLDGFTGEFYKAFKEELTPIHHKLFEKIQNDRRLPNSFYEASIILIPKPDKDPTKKENFRPISLMNIDAKIPTKLWQTASSNTLKR